MYPDPRVRQARYGIAWGALGAADACFQCALDYALSRVQFGGPIASFQLQQEKLARMVTELTKGQLLALQLGRLEDRGVLTRAQVSMGKLSSVAAAREICATARTILGANGILGEYPVMRHMQNHVRGDARPAPPRRRRGDQRNSRLSTVRTRGHLADVQAQGPVLTGGGNHPAITG